MMLVQACPIFIIYLFLGGVLSQPFVSNMRADVANDLNLNCARTVLHHSADSCSVVNADRSPFRCNRYGLGFEHRLSVKYLELTRRLARARK